LKIKGKTIAWTATGLGIVVLVWAGFMLRDRIQEPYYFRKLCDLVLKLETLDQKDFIDWSNKYGEEFWNESIKLRNISGYRFFFEKIVSGNEEEIVASAVAIKSFMGNFAFERAEINSLIHQYMPKIEYVIEKLNPNSKEKKILEDIIRLPELYKPKSIIERKGLPAKL